MGTTIPRRGEGGANGVVLVEVLVALGVFGVASLAIVATLQAGLRRSRAAVAASEALEAAAAVADTAAPDTEYPGGWRRVGTAGPDAIPGTGDDGPSPADASRCWRRVVPLPDAGWLWVQAHCGPSAPDGGEDDGGATGGAAAETEPGAGGGSSAWSAGSLAERVELVVDL